MEAAHDDTFLDELNKAWSEHKLSMSCIRDILLYMDRCWVGTTNQVREARDGEGVADRTLPAASVYDLGLRLFLQTVVQNPKVKPRLARIMLLAVQRERQGEQINRGVFKVRALATLHSGSVDLCADHDADAHRPGHQHTLCVRERVRIDF